MISEVLQDPAKDGQLFIRRIQSQPQRIQASLLILLYPFVDRMRDASLSDATRGRMQKASNGDDGSTMTKSDLRRFSAPAPFPSQELSAIFLMSIEAVDGTSEKRL